VAEDVQELLVRTADGRELEVLVSGPADAVPVVFHSGTPGGAVIHQPMARAAAENGLRLVTYGRPGYGRSTPQTGRTVADAAGDTAAVLDQLDAGVFVTMGHSGGGPHALACAALLPGRCRAAASVAGVAPWDAEGLDVMAGMGPENVEEFGLAVQGSTALTGYLEEQGEQLRSISGPDVADALGGLVPEVDKRVLTGELAEHYAAAFRKAMESGIAGWHDDDLAFVRPWGFQLADITVPVSVWQGAQDLMVPFAHGSWLAAHIPGATAHLFEEHGHLSLTVEQVPAILRELVRAARLPTDAPSA
jgi:pimeloyl-ACP methyl ester carboxylesterase